MFLGISSYNHESAVALINSKGELIANYRDIDVVINDNTMKVILNDNFKKRILRYIFII